MMVISLEELKKEGIDGIREIVAQGWTEFFKLCKPVHFVEIREFW